jgi:transposase InsO family protein
MGRGRADWTYHQGKHSQILAWHSNALWRTQPTNIEQWNTIFISKKFENFCATYGIKNPRSLVNHPMTNQNVERANGIILQGIKT